MKGQVGRQEGRRGEGREGARGDIRGGMDVGRHGEIMM